jgi:MSHA biogenesis protein MshM
MRTHHPGLVKYFSTMSSLYLDHFGLNRPPFKITPDLDFFFSGGRRGDILAALLHVATHEEGIITVVAEVGSGKTLLSRLMISQLPPTICTVYLANPCFSRDEILSAIARDLGLLDLPVSTEAKLSVLQQELLRRHAAGQRVLLVVDEAHAMPAESLEEIRLLSNLETASHKLINIMLFGQPELDALLTDPRLRQVRDRVIHRFELRPLPYADVCAYLDHRLRAAGWSGGALFSGAALALLAKTSGGRARRINLLADKCLLGAYAEGLRTVEVRHVQAARSELHADVPSASTPAWRGAMPWVMGSVLLACAMTAAALWLFGQRPTVVANRAPIAPALAMAASASPGPAGEPVGASAMVVRPAAPVPSPPHKAVVVPPVLADAEPALQSYLQRTQAHLTRGDANGFTLQLAALPRDGNAAKYLKLVSQQLDSSLIFAQLSSYNGRNFVSVYYGNFAATSQAQATLADLPESLKTNKPIVRTWARIKQDQAP